MQQSEAEERQRTWEKCLGITREEVEAAVHNPDQIVPGDGGILVAQVRRGNGLLRVPFAEIGGRRRILILYWTNQVKRYWQEA